MLVLTRRTGERIVIGNSIVVTVLEMVKNKVRIGISAPDDIRILREELTFGTAAAEESSQLSRSLERTPAYWAEASEVFLG